MCASNSAALASPKPSQAKRAALLTSSPTGPADRGEDRARAQSGVGKVGDDLDRAVGHRVAVVMDMRDHAPAVGEQRGDDRRADALAAAGHDRGSLHDRHCEERSDEAIQRRKAGLLRCARNDKGKRHARNAPPDRSCRPVARRARGAHRRRGRTPRSSAGTRRIAATARCASPATAPGITRASRSGARRWSACSPPCCAASPTAATSSSPRSKNSRIEVEATAFRALTMTMEGERRDAPHRLRARQRRRGHRRPRPSADRRRHARRPLAAPRRAPRARGRARPPALLRAGRHRARRRA